jgi:transcriptional regulator with XRE-family HTH domain
MSIAHILRQARTHRGLSLRDVEEISGVPNPTVSQVETGFIKNPSFEAVVRIARALGVKLSELAETVK